MTHCKVRDQCRKVGQEKFGNEASLNKSGQRTAVDAQGVFILQVCL